MRMRRYGPVGTKLRHEACHSRPKSYSFYLCRFADHVTKRNGGSGDENGSLSVYITCLHTVQQFVAEFLA